MWYGTLYSYWEQSNSNRSEDFIPGRNLPSVDSLFELCEILEHPHINNQNGYGVYFKITGKCIHDTKFTSNKFSRVLDLVEGGDLQNIKDINFQELLNKIVIQRKTELLGQLRGLALIKCGDCNSSGISDVVQSECSIFQSNQVISFIFRASSRFN